VGRRAAPEAVVAGVPTRTSSSGNIVGRLQALSPGTMTITALVESGVIGAVTIDVVTP
jgi:hypothetical protein